MSNVALRHMRHGCFLGLLSLLACTRRHLAPSVTMLGHSDTLWLATSEIDTSKPWIGRAGGLVFIPGSGTLLVRDAALNLASELAPDGTILYQYAPRKGSGPGEIQRLSGVFVNGTSVFLVDNRTRRILRYSHRGSLQNEIALRHGYASIAAMGDSAIIAVPGSDTGAFDIYSVTGAFLGSRGRVSDLPRACVADSCDLLGVCHFCEILSLADQSILVAEPTTPSIVRFDSSGHRTGSFRFESLPFVHAWWEESQRDIASHAGERPPNAVESKRFFRSPSVINDDVIAIPVLPPQRQLREHGRELWLFHLAQNSLDRFGYPAPSSGQDVAIDPASATAFAANAGGANIEAFPVPQRSLRQESSYRP